MTDRDRAPERQSRFGAGEKSTQFGADSRHHDLRSDASSSFSLLAQPYRSIGGIGILEWTCAVIALPTTLAALVVVAIDPSPRILAVTIVFMLTSVATALLVGRVAAAKLRSLSTKMAREDASTRELIRTGALPAELADLVKLVNESRQASAALTDIRRDLFRHLSHQIKSPLAMVVARANEIPRQSREFIVGTVDSIARLVDQMMVLALAESQDGAAAGNAFREVDVASVCRSVVASRSFAANAKGVQVFTGLTVGAEGLWVRGHEALIAELLANLIDNAIKYGHQGGRVWVRAAFKAPGKVIIEVEDNGPGLPNSELIKVFAPFYGAVGRDSGGAVVFGSRQNRASWTNEPGRAMGPMDSDGNMTKAVGDSAIVQAHGLGLAIVKSIALAHRGTVELRDAKLYGARGHDPEASKGPGLVAVVSLPALGGPVSS